MTILEIRNYIDSYARTQQRNAKERASYDYILGDLIGKSVGRIYNKSAKYPEIYEAYPTMFDSKEIIEKRKEQQKELSILRLKQFSSFHNAKLGGANKS